MYDPDYSSSRRSRGGGLGLTAKQWKYLTLSQKGNYLVKRGYDFSSTEHISKRIKKARNAVIARRLILQILQISKITNTIISH